MHVHASVSAPVNRKGGMIVESESKWLGLSGCTGFVLDIMLPYL